MEKLGIKGELKTDQNMALCRSMAEYYAGEPKYINHFLKVYGYAKAIGSLEGLGENALFILEAAALVHDIGIKPSIEKYGSGSGHYQELEGPAVARELLALLGYPADVIDRVAFLVSRHHTYTGIDGIDYQILVEADFLVNIDEGKMDARQIASIRNQVFKTSSGLFFLDALFPSQP